MAKREEYKYSIISYNQNLLRNESINIGLLVFTDDSYRYQLLPPNSNKINGLAYSQYFKDLFKENIKVLENSLSKHTISSLKELNEISNQIHFSKSRKIITSNIENIMSVLLDEYIGNYYFDEHVTANIVTARDLALKEFDNHKVLNNKVKRNIRIKPNKELNMKINIDFAYANGNDLNLINSVPASENSIDDWYTKMFLLSKKFDQSGNILLLNNSSSVQVNEISDMLKDLSSNEKVNAIDLGKSDGRKTFEKYIKKIKKSDSSEEKIDTLVAKSNIA
ncbi:hypothetical protein ACLUV9_04215 [Limosilactobacillus balticus]|uniref:hypothetical protein n=1 Tax=Limosilactobacillus balticus TaxID=2759747 RepID=UPI0039947F60